MESFLLIVILQWEDLDDLVKKAHKNIKASAFAH